MLSKNFPKNGTRSDSVVFSFILSLGTDVFSVSAVMDISDLIKGKVECDEEKQFFIPFFPYVFCHF